MTARPGWRGGLFSRRRVMFGAISDAGLLPQPEMLVRSISDALRELMRLKPSEVGQAG